MKALRLAAVAALLSTGFFMTAHAQVTLGVSLFTDSQISVTISGSVTGPAPSRFPQQLYLFSSVPAEDGWVLQTIGTDQVTFSGSPIVGVSYNGGGSASYNGAGLNYIVFDLSRNLVIGDSYTGVPITATFPANTFNPSALTGNLVLSWGASSGVTSTPFGTLQAIAPVPEPSTFALAGLGVLGLTGRRRRNRK